MRQADNYFKRIEKKLPNILSTDGTMEQLKIEYRLGRMKRMAPDKYLALVSTHVESLCKTRDAVFNWWELNKTKR